MTLATYCILPVAAYNMKPYAIGHRKPLGPVPGLGVSGDTSRSGNSTAISRDVVVEGVAEGLDAGGIQLRDQLAGVGCEVPRVAGFRCCSHQVGVSVDLDSGAFPTGAGSAPNPLPKWSRDVERSGAQGYPARFIPLQIGRWCPLGVSGCRALQFRRGRRLHRWIQGRDGRDAMRTAGPKPTHRKKANRPPGTARASPASPFRISRAKPFRACS